MGKKEEFIEVSAFSPNVPLCYRWSLLLAILSIEFIVLLLIMGQLVNGFLIILSFISFCYLFSRTVYKFLHHRKSNWENSPYRLIKMFIADNRLFLEETQVLGQDSNGKTIKKKVIVESVYLLYKDTPDELIIRFLKGGTNGMN